MKSWNDVKVVETRSFTDHRGELHTYTAEHISLNKLFDKQVVDVYVSVSREFESAVLAVHDLVFSDGSSISVDGEHDIAYLTTPYRQEDNFPNYRTSVLGPIYNQQNGCTSQFDEDGEENEDYWNWEDDD